MPVLEATGEITPRSALRYRPLGERAAHALGKPGLPTHPIAQRASRPQATAPSAGAEIEEPVVEWQQKITDPMTPVPPRRRFTTTKTRPQIPLPQLARKRSLVQVHPLFSVGLGMLAMLILSAMVSVLSGWLTTLSDDLHYGRPRTFQIDAWVGHHEQTGMPSHFLAINLHRHIEVIEISGGDAAQTHIYSGPQLYGAGDDLTPVTLRFIDVNADHQPDMLISFQGSRLVFLNAGDHFRPLLPGERGPVEQFLLHLPPE